MNKLSKLVGAKVSCKLFDKDVSLTPIRVKDMAVIKSVDKNSSMGEQVKALKPVLVDKLREAFPDEENYDGLYDELSIGQFMELQATILRISGIKVPEQKL